MALTYYFQKTGTNTWNVYVAANGTPIATAGGNPAPSTTITFPTNGGTPTAPAGTVAIDIPSVSNAVGAVTVPITGVALDVSGATQYGSQFGVTDLPQDGYAAGQLIGVADRGQRRDQRALLERRDPARRPARARHLPQPAGPAADRRQRLGAHRSPRATRSSAPRATATSACCRPARSRNRTST